MDAPQSRRVVSIRVVAAVAAWAACTATWSSQHVRAAQAADYPTKPIRIIVPYAPGGGTDTAARIVAQKLAEKWHETVVVDNRPGAAGIVGTDIVAKTVPDGHTLLFAAGAHAINPGLYAKLPYDAAKDFAPIAFVVTAPNILVVTPALPVTTVKDLIAFAKAKPGQLNYGSGGAGQTPHLAAELFKSMAGIDMRHVPYKGGAPATADLIAGRISVMFGGMVLTLPHVKSGKLRALATTGARRAKAVPELPTIAEAALPGYEADEWFGTWAPAGTPQPVSATLHGAIREILRAPAAQDRFAGLGAEAVDMDARAFGEFVRGQMAKWAKVIKEANIRAE